MKKLLIPFLASIVTASAVVACSFQLEHIAITVVMAVIVGVCTFFLVKTIEDNKTKYTGYLECVGKELHDLNSSINTLNEKSIANEGNIAALTELQKQNIDQSQVLLVRMEKTIGEFVVNNLSAVDSLKEASLRQLNELSENFSQHSSIICEKTKENTDALTQTINEKIDKGLDSANQLIQQFRNYTDASCKAFEEQIISSKQEMENMLSTVKSTVTSGVSDLNIAIEGSADKLSGQVSQNLNKIWDKNINQLLDCNDKLLKNTEKTIAESNGQLMTMHTEYNNKHISEIAEEYDSIMSRHIEKLQKEIIKQIKDFVKVNHSAFDKTATQMETLISTESLFVNKLSENNNEMFEILQKGNADQKNVVTIMVEKLEKKLEDNANKHSQNTQKHNLSLIDTLTQKFGEYCDGLVDKSAEAIANVQKDNNLKLQQMCNSIVEMSKENQQFNISCSENNSQIKQKMEELISRDSDFVERFSGITDRSVKNMDKIFKDYAKEISERTDKLNVDSARRFSDTMENYREEFIVSNAKALAAVQKENVDAITNANNHLAKLAEDSREDKQKMHDFEKCLIEVLKQMGDMIKNGNEKTENILGNFGGRFEDNLNDLKNLLDNKLKEYNNGNNGLTMEIRSVLLEVKDNTKNYYSILKSIEDSQRSLNTLTEKDLKLLERMVR